MEVLDFDGYSEILVESLEEADAFFKSEEYVKRMHGRLPR